jgi:hypothetical protein
VANASSIYLQLFIDIVRIVSILVASALVNAREIEEISNLILNKSLRFDLATLWALSSDASPTLRLEARDG